MIDYHQHHVSTWPTSTASLPCYLQPKLNCFIILLIFSNRWWSWCGMVAAVAITRKVVLSNKTTSSASQMRQKWSKCDSNTRMFGIKQCTIFDQAYSKTSISTFAAILEEKHTAYRVSSQIDVRKAWMFNGSERFWSSVTRCSKIYAQKNSPHIHIQYPLSLNNERLTAASYLISLMFRYKIHLMYQTENAGFFWVGENSFQAWLIIV